MASDIIWILGAADPEMAAIETLLHEGGQTVGYALDARGARVTPSGAYRAAAYSIEGEGINTTITAECCVTVECALSPLVESGQSPRLTVDHHRPGDVGFGRPPEEFLAASSLGQVIDALCQLSVLPDSWTLEPRSGHYCDSFAIHDWGQAEQRYVVVRATGDAFVRAIPHDLVIAAACDHCLGAAWQDQCPGVSRDDVRAYRARMATTRPINPIDPETYQLRFASTLHVLEDGATSGVRYVQLRHVHLSPGHEGPGWQTSVLDTRACGHLDMLPDVASYLGVAYLTALTPRPGERAKVVLGGATTPQMVRDFLKLWAPAQGLVDCYGDPERGFAGGYVP
jgi:hypothetical protein